MWAGRAKGTVMLQKWLIARKAMENSQEFIETLVQKKYAAASNRHLCFKPVVVPRNTFQKRKLETNIVALAKNF